MKFKSNRDNLKQNVNASELLVLPDPLEIVKNSDGQFNFNMGKGNDDMQNELADENKARYLHERNKQISLFACAKLLRELTKIELFRPKFNIMYIGCLCLIKQSKMLNQVCVNSLKMKTNQYHCVNFEEWLKNEKNPNRILPLLEEDMITMNNYWEHLFSIINDLIKSNDVSFDMNVLKDISGSNIDFNKVYTYLDNVLVKLFQYYLKCPDNIVNTAEGEKLLRCCGAMADVLMMEQKFPFKEGNDIFNWKNYKAKEKSMSRDALVQRMHSYRDREGAFNDDGCFLSSVVKKYCS